MSAACNWDNGDCNEVFVDAAAEAVRPCTCRLMYLQGQTKVCNSYSPQNGCFKASCDWSPFSFCEDIREALLQCPLWDAIVHRSLVSEPGLVFMKEGKGFTAAAEWEAGGSRPFPFWQGVGRCVNVTSCKTGPPPAGGIRDLEDGETWCDTSVNGNGRVLQIAQQQSECDDPSLAPDTITPCVDVGKGWGVCDAAVRLPSRGFEYDADMLKSILHMSPQQLFAGYPGCGTLPLMVRSNRAGRHGGGLFQQACDTGFEQKQLCWIGGLSAEASTSFLLSFVTNSAGGAGGGIYTSCFSLGFCNRASKMTLGMPIPAHSRAEVISLVENTAYGFGNDVATAPAKVSVVSLGKEYVPGKTPLDITFSLADAQGLSIVGSAATPISHLVQLLVLPVDAVCSTFADCQRLQLQPTESYYSNGAQATTSIESRGIPLRYCQISVRDVQFRLFLSTGTTKRFHSASVRQTMGQRHTQESETADVFFLPNGQETIWTSRARRDPTCSRCRRAQGWRVFRVSPGGNGSKYFPIHFLPDCGPAG